MKKVKDKSTMADLANLVISKRLDRIERMLKWIVMKGMMVDRGELAGMNYSPEAMGKQIDELVGKLPDLSDIIKP